jgi:hypothetical protein
MSQSYHNVVWGVYFGKYLVGGRQMSADVIWGKNVNKGKRKKGKHEKSKKEERLRENEFKREKYI